MSKDPTRGKPFTVVGVADNHDGTWSVVTVLAKRGLTFTARYEAGKWRFVLPDRVRTAMAMPFNQYLATQCPH